MFHLVSLSLQISLTGLPGPCLGLCVGVACFVACLGGFVFGFFLAGKFDLNHMLIPVVDRPCLALVRQCRKKKRGSSSGRPSFQVNVSGSGLILSVQRKQSLKTSSSLLKRDSTRSGCLLVKTNKTKKRQVSTPWNRRRYLRPYLRSRRF